MYPWPEYSAKKTFVLVHEDGRLAIARDIAGSLAVSLALAAMGDTWSLDSTCARIKERQVPSRAIIEYRCR